MFTKKHSSGQIFYHKEEDCLCDADYVGYTCRHLHQRIEEHKGSMIGQHMIEHGENESRWLLQSTEKMSKQVRVSVV